MAATATAGTGLIVPIRVEALLVGNDDSRNQAFLPAFASFDKLGTPSGTGGTPPYLGKTVTAPPFQGAAPLKPGIHLHWNLPRGLRQGTASHDQQQLDMPPVPDRWLVTRVQLNPSAPAQPPQLTSWVVESNHLSTTSAFSPTSVPADPAAGGPPYRYLGRVYSMQDWLTGGSQGQEYLQPLTAMGFGIPDFASYYPNCRNVFGMLDDSAGAAGSVTAYVVTGWYSRPSDDPLSSGTISGADNRYGWTFRAGAAPTFTLCSGVVHQLQWDPGRSWLGPSADGSSSDVEFKAFGNTMTEALSTIIARGLTLAKAAQSTFKSLLDHSTSSNPPGPGAGVENDIETILNACQIGALKRIGQPGGMNSIGRTLYDHAYCSLDGGTQWIVRPRSATAEPGPAGRPAPPVSIPPAAADSLRRLNEQQARTDADDRMLATLETQVFMDWTKYMELAYGGAEAAAAGRSIDPPALIAYIGTSLTLLETVQNRIATGRKAIADAREALAAALPAELGLELAETPAAGFSAPVDPVLLLAGKGVPPPPPDETDTLGCRLTDETLSALTVSGPNGPATLPASAWATSFSGAAAFPPTVSPAVPALVQEALLLLPDNAAALAAMLGDPSRIGGTPSSLSADQLRQALQQALGGGSPGDLGWSGVLPDMTVGYRQWASPWNPVALSWEVALTSMVAPEKDYQADFVTGNFRFDPESLCLSPTSTAPASGQIQSYSGTALISPSAGTLLKHQLKEWERFGNSQASALLQKLEEFPTLVQPLSGFHAALLQRDQTLQLTVSDPQAVSTGNTTGIGFTKSVAAAVTTDIGTSPLPDSPYQPLLTGELSLTKLWLIDQFGRSVSLDTSLAGDVPTTLTPSQLFGPPPASLGVMLGNRFPKNSQGTAMLPPLRLVQPSRLNLAWLPAANGSGPICGWVVPNELDGSLMLYDADGRGVGSLASGTGGAGLRPVPGGDATAAGAAACNPVLSAFVAHATAQGPGYIAGLRDVLQQSSVLTQSNGRSGSNATAVLMASPLALVQATIALELDGLPAWDQSYGALQADIGGGDPQARHDRGLRSVRFPIHFGGPSEVDDGLVGFFASTAPGGAVSYDTFYSLYPVAADGASPQSPLPDGTTITVAVADTAPQTVTMLIDPRCAVHVYDGIHPVGTLTIPPDLCAQALERMSFQFPVGPVLSLDGKVDVPVPAEGGGDWSWIGRSDGAWTANSIAPVTYTSTQQAPQTILEGWLVLSRKETGTGS